VLRAAGQLYLLGQAAVLDELRLNEGQRAKVQELSARVAEQRKESFHDLGRLSPAERGRRFLEQARANEASVNAILTEGQRQRLRQIGLQADVVGAFRDPEVVVALQLTAEQREKIRGIEEEMFFSLMRVVRPGLPPEVRDQAPERRERLPSERILAVLTEEQARKWREMTGEPFKETIPFPLPFGPGFPPPGPRPPPR
jgi:hypothetical protein